MNTRFAVSTVVLVLLASLLTGAPPAQAQDAEALIQRLEQKYHSGQALRAKFTQMTQQDDRSTTLSGTLTLQGDSYRVETGYQTLVTDGATTWIYTPSRKQVLVNDYVSDEATFSPSRFFDGYRERYRVTNTQATWRHGTKHFKLTLEPREPGAFFQVVTLWMRASDAVVTRLKVTDPGQSSLTFTLRDVTFGVATEPGTFRLDPPESAEVVDLRS